MAGEAGEAGGNHTNHGDQFDHYEVTARDPGPILLIITVVISVALYALLPCMVACAKRRDRQRREREALLKVQEEDSKGQEMTRIQHQEAIGQQRQPSSSGISDVQPGKSGKPSKTIPNAWKHSNNPNLSRRTNSTEGSAPGSRREMMMSMKARNLMCGADGDNPMNWSMRMIDNVATATHKANDIKRARMQKRLFQIERNDDDSTADGLVNDGAAMDAAGTKQEISGIFSYDAMPDGGDDPNKPTMGVVKDMPRIHPCRRVYFTFRNIVKWDKENRRILKLAGPYVAQALVTGIAEAARVGILARKYDTRSMSAYVIVVMLVGFTAELVASLNEAQGVMSAYSIGTGNTKLTGQYTQAGMILFFVSVLPVTIMWMFVIGPVLGFFGFDEETVQLGVEFTQSYVWAEVVMGIDGSIQTLLDISGHEIYSAVFTGLREIAVTLTIFIAPFIDPNVELKHVGFMFLVNMIVFLILNVAYIACMGFWRKYYSGMIYSFSLANLAVPKGILTTALPLSFGYLLTYGEWEILTIFAAFLGPAEVAAWGILGTLWDVLEEATEAVAEAAEVRVAFLLGSGKPTEAKMSSYKSILLAFVISSILSILVFIWGDDLSELMTSEETLHKLVDDLIPLFAMGNIALAVGSMAWTLVGAQGRYTYSTAVGFVGSWGTTIPLAAIFSIRMGIDLQGQTAAVVIGYMVSGTWNTFTLLRSDWKQISDNVIEHNTAHDIEIESDDDSVNEEDSAAQNLRPPVRCYQV